MAKARWERILELEEKAKRGSASSPEYPPPLPPGSIRPDPLTQQMAADIREMRRQQSFNFYAPGVITLIILGLIYWFLRV